MLGKLQESLASYRDALAIRPNYAKAHNNLGNALQGIGKVEEGVASYRRALALKPDYAEAHCNLGLALQALGNLEEALASYHKALTIKPDYAVARSNLLFTLLSSMVDLDTVYEEHCRWEKSHAMQHQPLQHQCDGDVNKRLRVGFVSADFRTHSVGYFLEAPFSSYDRERMTIYCYSNSHLEDETTARLRPLVKEWRNIVGWADEKVIDAIQADAIDILVDLSGHTRGNRLTVFARKPAPIQVTWLGYPGITTGLTAIDYRLSDEVADPLGVADTLCVEQLIRLPNGHHCYHPSADAPEIGPLPMTSNRVITFGSFNNLTKITPEVVDSWVDILQAVPRSRLLLKNASLDSPGVRERYMSLFAASIEPERIIFKAWVPSRQAHFALYNEVDIALDTFPFNGVTTTCEALWMGVPVMTWCGDRHSARLGASLLTRVSLEDLVASDINGYVTTTVTLAGDPERLEGLRSGLRDRMRASPLCDGVGFSHDLESMFRNAWQNWCQQH
jgi:predicted O-linked N-acetylglucosamine transferase (SPINDLY family)